MSKQAKYSKVLLFCLCFHFVSCKWAQAEEAPITPAVVQSEHALRAALASGKPTPLDALTSYGRHEAVRLLRWNEQGLVGFGFAPLIRELDHEQLTAVVRFLGVAEYLPMLDKQLVGPPLRLPPPSKRLQKDLEKLQQFANENDSQRAKAPAAVTLLDAPAVLQRYQTLFGTRLRPAMIAKQPLGDLLLIFEAATLAANGNPTSSAVDDMARVHLEFKKRGVDTRRTLDNALMYAMLTARRFDDARTFTATRPHLADVPVPQIIDQLGPGFRGRSAFAYDASHNTLTRLALPASPDAELVMVVGAGCHNSDNALKAIRDDVALQTRLKETNFLIVTAPTAPIETSLITRWNAANPTMPIRAPYNVQEWQGVKVHGIPAFFLLRNGKVVDYRTGWPVDGKAELVKLINAAAK